MTIVFATHNQNKYQEVKELLPKHIELLSLTDIGCHDEIPETATTLEGNAQLKADFVTEKYGMNCFADDTGLLIDALEGKPGVYSARYAGAEKSAENNMNKVLSQLSNTSKRTAHFKTVIALNLTTEKRLFEGIVHGNITLEKKGKKGFGYDPIFQPLEFNETFAELSMTIKNEISHRAKAIKKLIHYLKNTTP